MINGQRNTMKYKDATILKKINQYCADHLGEYIVDKENAVLLDIPCGTGKTGEIVQKSGFGNIHGTDLSEGMLEQAKRKNIYRKVFKSCVTQTSKLDCADNVYDGSYSIRGISSGMLELEPTVKEMVRVLKPGGILIYTVNLNIGVDEFMRVHSELLTKQKVELIKMEKRYYFQMKGADLQCFSCVMRKL